MTQVSTLNTEGLTGFIWKIAEILNILGEQKFEWETYVRGLKHSGFVLYNDIDSIVWSWDSKVGKVSAKQAYEVQFLDDSEDVSKELLIDVLKWHISFEN